MGSRELIGRHLRGRHWITQLTTSHLPTPASASQGFWRSGPPGHPGALGTLPRQRPTWAHTSSMSQLPRAGSAQDTEGCLPRSPRNFPASISQSPPNTLCLPSLDHLVQQQVPQIGAVQSERPVFKCQLCYPQAVSPRKKLPTSMSLSILPCKTSLQGSANSISLAGCGEDKGDGVGAMLSSELATSAQETAAAAASRILSQVCRGMAGCPHWAWNAQESNMGSTRHSMAACQRRF